MARLAVVFLFLVVFAIAEVQQKNAEDLVTEFVRKSGSKIFGKAFSKFCVLVSNKVTRPDEYKELLRIFNDAAVGYEGKVKFVYIDSFDDENGDVLNFLGASKGEVKPVILFLDLSDGLFKYKMDIDEPDELTKESVVKFVDDCAEGKNAPFMKSEELPEDWNEKPVKQLVGKNFEKVVFNKKKSTFVFLYAEWCAACQNTMPEIEKLGDFYKDDKTVVIARMDSTQNDVSGMPIIDVPTIKLFVKGAKKGLTYTDDDRSFDAFVKFIEENKEGEKSSKTEAKKDSDEKVKKKDKEEMKADEEKPGAKKEKGTAKKEKKEDAKKKNTETPKSATSKGKQGEKADDEGKAKSKKGKDDGKKDGGKNKAKPKAKKEEL